MSQTTLTFDEALIGWSRERLVHDEHPGAARLLEYHAGRLTESAAEAVREHAAACAECAELLLLFPQACGCRGASPPADFLTAAGKREILARLEVRRAEAARRRARHWRDGLGAAAAVCLLAVALTSSDALHQRSRLAEMMTPQANGPVVQLLPHAVERSRGGDDPAMRIEIAPDVHHWTLLVPVLGDREYAGYRLEIVDRDGARLWESRDPRVESYTTAIQMPRGFLAAGEHRVRLYGVDANTGAEGELIEEIPFRLLSADGE